MDREGVEMLFSDERPLEVGNHIVFTDCVLDQKTIIVGTGTWYDYKIGKGRHTGRLDSGKSVNPIVSSDGTVLLEQCWALLSEVTMKNPEKLNQAPRFRHSFLVSLGGKEYDELGWRYVALPHYDAVNTHKETPYVLLYRAVFDVDCQLTRDVLSWLKEDNVEGFEEYYKKYGLE